MRHDLFTVSVREDGSTATLGCQGEIDLSTVSILDAALAEQRRPGQSIVIDLSGVEFMDSTGIKLLIEADALSRQDGHTVTFTNPSPAVSRVLEITGVRDHLPFID
ncbi:MAG: STAS domain-containing protein [Thermoleophilaceae bacterium]|nr:STAS domain-containing protein [Thermoleophilaceae bacterium]